MSLNGKENKFSQKPLVPEGNNAARCYSIVDLGTQKLTYMGETKEVAQVLLTWEFPDFTHVFDEQLGPQPLVIGQKYTVALGSKAKLAKMLMSWRNVKEIKGGAGFLKPYLNQWCLASVIHGVSKKDSTIKFANIGNNGAGISSMPTAMKDIYKNKPVLNPPVYFDFDEFNIEVFNTLPEWIQKIIQLSPEWAKAASKGQTAGYKEAEVGGIVVRSTGDNDDF